MKKDNWKNKFIWLIWIICIVVFAIGAEVVPSTFVYAYGFFCGGVSLTILNLRD